MLVDVEHICLIRADLHQLQKYVGVDFRVVISDGNIVGP